MSDTDVTEIVEALRDSFVRWGESYAYESAVTTTGLLWLSLPIISTIAKAIIRGVLTVVAQSAIMEIFFLNTAYKKASQAVDYLDAVKAKNSLPSTATDEEYENAEKVEMSAFRLFVVITK